MEKYELAEKDYMQGMKYKDIATKYGTTINTVKSWKKRYWCEKKGAPKRKKGCTQKESAHTIADDGTKETLKNENLNPEQQMFCIYYSRTFNATKSYQKAYGCSYEVANVRGPMLLVKSSVKAEINRLKEIKRQQILAGEEDIVELQMRIAFADIGEYVTFGREEVPVMAMNGPVMVEDETGEKVQLTKEINSIRLSESDVVDTQLIKEIKQGRDGIGIKLADRQKAIDWLSKYFLLHPDDRYKAEFDKKRAEVNDNSAEDILKNIKTITDILQNPVGNRNIADFE